MVKRMKEYNFFIFNSEFKDFFGNNILGYNTLKKSISEKGFKSIYSDEKLTEKRRNKLITLKRKLNEEFREAVKKQHILQFKSNHKGKLK